MKKKWMIPITLGVIVFVFLTGWVIKQNGQETMPNVQPSDQQRKDSDNTQPLFEGNIVEKTRDDQFMMHTSSSKQLGASAQVTLVASTNIVREHQGKQTITDSDNLSVGSQVEVWCQQPMLKIEPAQCEATKIVIKYQSKQEPSPLISIHGEIIQRKEQTIDVAYYQQEDQDQLKATVTITDDTDIVVDQSSGNINDLQTGQKVEVWYPDGPKILIYPMQVTAEKIVIK